MQAKIKYICKKFINHQIKKCLLFRCRQTVDSRYNANFKLDQSVSAIHDSPPYFWDQWGWPPTEPLTVTHARAHWWTLDLANAFVSPGVNSRGELVPSHGASRRRLGDKENFDVLSEGPSSGVISGGRKNYMSFYTKNIKAITWQKINQSDRFSENKV
jgi:hypothetical protein